MNDDIRLETETEPVADDKKKKRKGVKTPAPVTDDTQATATDVVDESATDNAEGKKPFSLFKRKKVEEKKKDYERFTPGAEYGLNTDQVNQRLAEGLNNKSTKKYSKTYRSIFIGNICTFFNLLGLLATIFLLLARASIGQFMFVIIFAANIFWGIFQEIRAKIKIDKLTGLTSSTA